MRLLTIGFSLTAVILAFSDPAVAVKEGVPGRRVGGGTRWTAPRPRQATSLHNKLSVMSVASRAHLITCVKLEILYGS